MNDFNEEHTIVTRTLIAEDQRLSHTAKLFGAHFPMVIEPVVYGITGRMAESYNGSYWSLYEISGPDWLAPGFYMAPEGDQIFQVSCDNYFTGELSADALGITACLYAYSHLSFSKDKVFGMLMADHYHRLRSFMFEHPEVAAILRAID
jgi:Antirestriction protein